MLWSISLCGENLFFSLLLLSVLQVTLCGNIKLLKVIVNISISFVLVNFLNSVELSFFLLFFPLQKVTKFFSVHRTYSMFVFRMFSLWRCPIFSQNSLDTLQWHQVSFEENAESNCRDEILYIAKSAPFAKLSSNWI